jgi:hypothetical protein
MTEVSPPRGPNPADWTMLRGLPENRRKTGVSSLFSELLQGPRRGLNSANGPVSHGELSTPAQTSVEGGPRAPHEPVRRQPESGPGEEARDPKPVPEAVLDPLYCQLAMNQELGCFVQPNPSAVVSPAALPIREDLQNLLTGLARRVAWGGDRRKASARIELGEGALAGATLVVHTDQHALNVAQGWQERIARRLEGRGLSARVKVG